MLNQDEKKNMIYGWQNDSHPITKMDPENNISCIYIYIYVYLISHSDLLI